MYGWEESLLMTGGIVTKMEIRKNFKDRDKLFVCNNDEIKKGEQFLIFSREIYTKKRITGRYEFNESVQDDVKKRIVNVLVRRYYY